MNDIWEFIIGLGVVIILAHCAGWWIKAVEEAKRGRAVRRNVLVWPGGPDYSDLTDLQIDPHGFHEECGDR